MAFDLEEKVVLVAGGAGYLGQPICHLLTEQGATVIIADAALDRADALAAKLVAAGRRASVIKLDGGDEASCEAAVAFAIDTYGRLDTLVVATHRVNAIAPGPFPTQATQQQYPDFVQRLADKVPLGRIGRQNEVAGTVAYLAADESSYMSGTTLRVDGGWTAW